MMNIAVVNGVGVNPEIMAAVLVVFNANQIPIEYYFVDLDKWVFGYGLF